MKTGNDHKKLNVGFRLQLYDNLFYVTVVIFSLLWIEIQVA